MAKYTLVDGQKGEVVLDGFNANFTELYNRDASGYGFLPSASAAINVAALQSALDVGGIITVITPGTYEMNATVYIGSNTKLVFSQGVILKKIAFYNNVILNKGALTKTWNEFIEIDGLNIECNGKNVLTGDIDELRGHVSFYYVRYLIIRNFYSDDGPVGQFMIQAIRWEYIYFNNIHIESLKDGIVLGVGHDAVLENIYTKTLDDAMAFYGVGYALVTLEVGDVYNIVVRNMHDDIRENSGYMLRPMSASWADYLIGNTYKTSDVCVNGGRIYICNNDPGFSAVGANAPIHSTGIVTGADLIEWKYAQDGSIYKADVYNITLDSITSTNVRPMVAVLLIDHTFQRQAYPGTETESSCYGFKIVNSYKKDSIRSLVLTDGNFKDLIISNCVFDNLAWLILSTDNADDSNPTFKVSVSGCTFKNMPDEFIDSGKSGQTIDISMSGNNYIDSLFVLDTGGTGKIRLNNYDIPIDFEDQTKITPTFGDVCRFNNGLYGYVGNGKWKIISADETDVYEADMVTNGDFQLGTGVNADDWTQGDGLTRVDNGGGDWVMDCDGSQAATSLLYQAGTKPVSSYFLYIFKISGYSVGDVTIRYGAADYGTARGANGTWYEILKQKNVYEFNTLQFSDDFIGKIEEVSVQKIII